MEMKLFVDSGNSRLKWAIIFREYPKAGLLATSGSVDITAIVDKHKDRYLKNSILNSVKKLREHANGKYSLLNLQKIVKVYMASVNPRIINKLINCELKEIFLLENFYPITTQDNKKIILSENHKIVFKINRDKPEELGVDRWLAMLGLTERLMRKNYDDAFILSVGTATVLDKIKIHQGKKNSATTKVIHEGGYIVPGFAMMENSLNFLTSGVRGHEFRPLAFPTNTVDSVMSGVYNVQAALSFIVSERVPVFLYGGNIDKFTLGRTLARKFLQRESNIIKDPWLVFKGLNQLSNCKS